MKKIYEKYYRVECNYGSRYFSEIEKAAAFFRRKQSKGLDVELWEVTITISASNIYGARQKLLNATPSALRKCD